MRDAEWGVGKSDPIGTKLREKNMKPANNSPNIETKKVSS
jgi:hypothetical protein